MNILPTIKNDTYNDAGLNSIEQTQVGTGGDNDLGQEEFLTLLTTQLASQDPFKPMENTDFIAQMAQFSSLEGINDLTESFESLASSLSSNQALQASSLVGRSVLMATDVAFLPNEGFISGNVNTEAPTQTAILHVTNDSGELVTSIELGDLPGPETVEFAWDGKDAEGEYVPAGAYQLRLEGNVNGENVAIPINLRAYVGSVNIQQGASDIVLNLLGLGSVNLSQVQEIGL
ncbi:MAG: flagellar hook assembly protein FlgD [Pseudomonadota bacterium]